MLRPLGYKAELRSRVAPAVPSCGVSSRRHQNAGFAAFDHPGIGQNLNGGGARIVQVRVN